MFPFDGFGGMCGENSCNVFLVLFTVLWALAFAMLCGRSVLMFWHAFLVLELRLLGFFPPFSFLLIGGFGFFFVKHVYHY
jgi:hypothetical protein